MERVDEDDDDSLLGRAPTLSMPLDEDNYTTKSVELPRRALSEQPLSRSKRGSFGIRLSDVADLSNLSALSGAGFGDSFSQPNVRDEDDDDFEVEEDENTARFDRGGDTEDLRRHNLRLSFGDFPTVHSDPVPGGDDGTFVLDGPEAISQRSSGFGAESTPVADTRTVVEPAEEAEDDAQPDVIGFDDEDEMEDVTDDEPIATEVHVNRPVPSTAEVMTKKPPRAKSRKEQKYSKHGIAVPSLPPGIVKKVAAQFSRSTSRGKAKLGKDSLLALEDATEWFFEQAGEDLGAYAAHAGRRTIDESDVVQLLRRLDHTHNSCVTSANSENRQRHIGKNATIFSLAERYLPKELLQDIRVASLP